MSTQVSIRAFLPTEIHSYKSMRLEALQKEASMFGNSYAFESTFTEQQWQDRLTNPNGVCFGLYSDQNLIGITSIIINSEKPEEAYMTQSYIQQKYRGQGLSALLYEARIKWAKKKGLKRLVIGHKASNLVSKKANQHFGFSYTYEELREWPDGSVEPMLYYELNLGIS